MVDDLKWRELVKFKKKLRGTGGSVTLPTEDFLALMDEAEVARRVADAAIHVGDITIKAVDP